MYWKKSYKNIKCVIGPKKQVVKFRASVPLRKHIQQKIVWTLKFWHKSTSSRRYWTTWQVNFKKFSCDNLWASSYRTPPRARCGQTSTHAGHKPGQRRSEAKRTTNSATEESNGRKYTCAIYRVTNLFTVEAETATVGLTECRLYWGRPRDDTQLTGSTSNTLPSEWPDTDQGRCRDWLKARAWGLTATDDSSEHRVRTTPCSIGWERCRTRVGEPEYT